MTDRLREAGVDQLDQLGRVLLVIGRCMGGGLPKQGGASCLGSYRSVWGNQPRNAKDDQNSLIYQNGGRNEQKSVDSKSLVHSCIHASISHF